MPLNGRRIADYGIAGEPGGTAPAEMPRAESDQYAIRRLSSVRTAIGTADASGQFCATSVKLHLRELGGLDK